MIAAHVVWGSTMGMVAEALIFLYKAANGKYNDKHWYKYDVNHRH
jgi:hypothetical protein